VHEDLEDDQVEVQDRGEDNARVTIAIAELVSVIEYGVQGISLDVLLRKLLLG
jgi:hypothetical protein